MECLVSTEPDFFFFNNSNPMGPLLSRMGPLERAAPNSASAHGYDARFARAGHAVAGSLGRRVRSVENL